MLFSERIFVQNQVLRIYYKPIEIDCAFPAQFAFAVSKKIFANAVDRNRIKRLMRESIRLQKPEIYASLKNQNKQYLILLSYQAKEVKTFKEIDEAIQKLLHKILNEAQ
ncbi:MAG: ribonuclease P protein component [Bacteroidetes bacterium]|nr:ribonuclease P protein component [Bacteroidota bacterium]